MRKKKQKIKFYVIKTIKSLLIGVIVIILSTIGIDAVDHYDNISESIAGRLFAGKQEGPCPSDMVLVQADFGNYCVDIYENSSGQDCPNKNPNSPQESKTNLDLGSCKPVSTYGSLPWTNITQDQAIYACAKAGKRLATNQEWLQAALGTPDRDKGWGLNDCHVSENWETRPGSSGTGPLCVSFAGAYDMIGNVWEWVNGTVQNGFFDGRPLPADGFVNGIYKEDGLPSDTKTNAPLEYYNDYFWIKNSGIRAIARGGYFNNKNEAGQYSYYIVSEPSGSSGATGFRCVKSIKQ